MQTDLTKLPPPPAGKTGLTFAALQKLPPPPTGATGMTLAQAQAAPIAPLPSSQNPTSPDYVTTGSAGESIMPNSTLGQNIKAIPGQLLQTGKGIANFFTSGTGQDIAAGMPNTSGATALDQSNQALAASDLNFIKAMGANQKAGKPLTPSQQSLLTQIQNRHATTASDLTPALDKTNEQVAGDFAGLGANILSGGALESGAKVLAKPAEGALQGFIQGAKTGAVQAAIPGAAYGLSTG